MHRTLPILLALLAMAPFSALADDDSVTSPFIQASWSTGNSSILKLSGGDPTAQYDSANTFSSAVFAAGVRYSTNGDLRQRAALFEAGAFLEEVSTDDPIQGIRSVGIFVGGGVRIKRLGIQLRYSRGSGTIGAETQETDYSGDALVNSFDLTFRIEYYVSPILGFRWMGLSNSHGVWSPPQGDNPYYFESERVQAFFFGIEIDAARLFG